MSKYPCGDVFIRTLTVIAFRTHHAAAQHHGISALPMKTLDEFTKGGAKLTGGAHERHEEYAGPPRQYNDKLSTTMDQLGFNNAGAGAGAGVGPGAGSTTGGINSHHQPTDSGVSGVGGHANSGSGHRGMGTGMAGAGVAGAGVGTAAHRHRRGSNSSYSSSSDESVGGTRRKKDKLSRKAVGAGGAAVGGTTGTAGTDTGKTTKPSLMERLDPRKDADRDGKAGIGD